MSPDTLNIIGLVLGIAASWALAYPILWGYPKRNRRAIAETQLSNLRRHIKEMDTMTDALPEPPYSRDEKDVIKKDLRIKWKPEVEDLEKKIERLGEGHEWISFALSTIGMLLLTAAFAFQLWAVLMPKTSGLSAR